MSGIRNREHMGQLVDFSGMTYGDRGIRPTDIDLSMDFGGALFVFVELKRAGYPLTAGQKYHLQYLCKAINASGKVAVAILAHHETPEGADILAGEAKVSKVLIENEWTTATEHVTLHKYIEALQTPYTAAEINQ